MLLYGYKKKLTLSACNIAVHHIPQEHGQLLTALLRVPFNFMSLKNIFIICAFLSLILPSSHNVHRESATYSVGHHIPNKLVTSARSTPVYFEATADGGVTNTHWSAAILSPSISVLHLLHKRVISNFDHM